jgi:hypothetical protein
MKARVILPVALEYVAKHPDAESDFLHAIEEDKLYEVTFIFDTCKLVVPTEQEMFGYISFDGSGSRPLATKLRKYVNVPFCCLELVNEELYVPES